MRLMLLIVAGALMISGCGSTPDKKLDVQLMKSDPPMGCEMVGDVQAEGDDMNEAKQNLRLKADERGGNYIRLDALDISGGDAIAAGAAFNCKRAGFADTPEGQ
jgi:hypothetical protein